MILTREDLWGAKWVFMRDALKEMERRELALKLWLAATAKDTKSPDVRGVELAISHLNRRGAS